MGSKILKFLLVGLFIPTALSTTANASITAVDANEVRLPNADLENRPPNADLEARPPTEKELALVTEESYSILMRARFGIQNWAKSDVYQGSSALSYGTDIGVFWRSGFGIAGHFWTGQSSATKVTYGSGVDGTLRLSTLAVGPAYQLRKGRAFLQAKLFLGQVLLNENYTENGQSIGSGDGASPSAGYRIYGAGVGVDLPIRDGWFGTVAGEYGWMNPSKNVRGEGFAVNTLSTGVGYRF